MARRKRGEEVFSGKLFISTAQFHLLIMLQMRMTRLDDTSVGMMMTKRQGKGVCLEFRALCLHHLRLSVRIVRKTSRLD